MILLGILAVLLALWLLVAGIGLAMGIDLAEVVATSNWVVLIAALVGGLLVAGIFLIGLGVA